VGIVEPITACFLGGPAHIWTAVRGELIAKRIYTFEPYYRKRARLTKATRTVWHKWQERYFLIPMNV